MKNRILTPALIVDLTSLNNNYHPFYETVGKELEQLKFKRIPDLKKHKQAVVYQYGNAFLNFLVPQDFFFRFKGVNHFAVIEPYSDTHMLISIQNYQYQTTPEELNQKFGKMVASITALAPNVTTSEWFEASSLPKTFLSFPLTFLKRKGLLATF